MSFPALCVCFYIQIRLASSAAGPGNSNDYAHTYLSPLMRHALWSHKCYSLPGNKCWCVYVCLRVYILDVLECTCVGQTSGKEQSSLITSRVLHHQGSYYIELHVGGPWVK